MTIKQILILSSSLVLSSAAFANMFVGAGTGVGIMGGSKDVSGTNKFGPVTPETYSLTNANVLINVYAGYSYQFTRFYLGSELGFTYFGLNKKLSKKLSGQTYTANDKISYDLTLALMPGFEIFNNFNLYGKLGVGMFGFKATSSSNSGIAPYGDFSNTLFGGEFGGGVMYSFPLVSLRLEYDYLKPNGLTTYGKEDVWFNKLNAKYSLNINQIIFGAQFNF